MDAIIEDCADERSRPNIENQAVDVVADFANIVDGPTIASVSMRSRLEVSVECLRLG